MKSNIKSVLLSSIFLAVFFGVTAQYTPIGLGWAKNSLNGIVFRKNSVTSFQGNQFTSFYDSLGNVVLAKRALGTDTWDTMKTQYKGELTDAHNAISIAVDGNGYLHMAWDHHGVPLRYCMGTDSLSLAMGSKQSMIGTLENVVTYPEFFRLPSGDLIFMYRDGYSGQANCVLNKYSITEKKWTRLHNNLISGENTRSAYWQSFVDKNGTIHVSWVWRETSDVASNHDMCYTKSSDGGLTWHKSTGEQYTLPITAATAEYIYNIPQSSALMNQTSMYATGDGKPYIASYWRDANTNRPQYQVIFLDNDMNWQRRTFSYRLTSFTLGGGGTKKVPISRPQILVDDSGAKPVVYLIYRDTERESKVSVNICYDLEPDTIQIFVHDVTDFTVNDWEPSYDIDLWKDSLKMNIFVQNMQQGDGETLGTLPAQPVYIMQIPGEILVLDTIVVPVDVAGKATDPVPLSGAKEISVDTILSWTAGNKAVTHQIYFGTTSSNMTLLEEVGTNSIDITDLEPGTRYFWRVDEVVGQEITKGSNWYFTTKAIVGLGNVSNERNVLKVYPQPVKDILQIENMEKEELVEIYNISGKKVYSVLSIGLVDVSALTDGIYIVKLKGNHHARFVKMN